MAISPRMGENLIANEIRRIYSEAELRTIEKLVKYIKMGEDAPDYSKAWAASKIRSLRQLKGELDEDVIAYLRNTNPDVMDAIEEAYKKGQKSAVADLRKTNQEVIVEGGFSASNKKAVEAIAGETIDKLNSTHLRILRTTEDVYRQAVAEASSQVITGVDTRREAAQRVVNTLANQGISGFVDEAGRSWNISSYAEMATRSASGRAAIDGMASQLQENDKDLVIVSDHGGECELCRPWERQVLSLSGNSDKYPSLSEARSAGLFHPNCRHTINLYVEGLTEEVGNRQADSDRAGYEARQRQRYHERKIRQWKRRKAGALSEKEEQKAQSYITKWQKRQKKHLDENENLRRKFEREQINEAR